MVFVIPAVEAGTGAFSCPLEESVRQITPFLWIGHGVGRRVNDNRTKILPTGVCGDVVHVSHFSSHALVEIKTSRQDWTGRLNFHEKFNQGKEDDSLRAEMWYKGCVPTTEP